jgi:hypothetical protein
VTQRAPSTVRFHPGSYSILVDQAEVALDVWAFVALEAEPPEPALVEPEVDVEI